MTILIFNNNLSKLCLARCSVVFLALNPFYPSWRFYSDKRMSHADVTLLFLLYWFYYESRTWFLSESYRCGSPSPKPQHLSPKLSLLSCISFQYFPLVLYHTFNTLKKWKLYSTFFLFNSWDYTEPALSSLNCPSKSLPDDLHSFGSPTGLKMAKLPCR